jgi:hypothetical protein
VFVAASRCRGPGGVCGLGSHGRTVVYLKDGVILIKLPLGDSSQDFNLQIVWLVFQQGILRRNRRGFWCGALPRLYFQFIQNRIFAHDYSPLNRGATASIAAL